MPELQAPDGTSLVTYAYASGGALKSIGSSYGNLITQIERDPDGALRLLPFGDAANTKLKLAYDAQRRLREETVDRRAPGLWTSPTGGYVLPDDAIQTLQLQLRHNVFRAAFAPQLSSRNRCR